MTVDNQRDSGDEIDQLRLRIAHLSDEVTRLQAELERREKFLHAAQQHSDELSLRLETPTASSSHQDTRELAALRATKTFRWTSGLRQFYGRRLNRE